LSPHDNRLCGHKITGLGHSLCHEQDKKNFAYETDKMTEQDRGGIINREREKV